MPRYTSKIQLITAKETLSSTLTGNYTEVFNIKQEVANDDGFLTIATNTNDIGTNSLRDAKALIIKNSGQVGAEIQIIREAWASAAPDTNGALDYTSHLLAANEYMYLPSLRQVGYDADESSANGASLTDLTPHADMEIDSTANVDSATADGVVGSASSTRLYLEPYTSAANCTANLFVVGDLIQIRDEIMEVTAIGDKSDLANNYLTVIRGKHGSTAGTAAVDADPVEFPFFNAYESFTSATGGYGVVQTNKSGKFKAMNFFGYGRNVTKVGDGIVPGSISGSFFNPGYQSLGLSGITPSTNSGLAVSTTYYLKINVDAAGVQEISFLTDSSNVNFGGENGIIDKLNTTFRGKFYDAGYLFEKKVTVAIVNGDVRFTSGQRLSTSSIALSAGDSGASTAVELLAQQIGRIPTAAKIGASTAVAARLPESVIYDNKSYVPSSNISIMFYDDGHGRILSGSRLGVTGTINYETGAIDLAGCPPDASFVVSANYGSAHAGGNEFSTTLGNCITSIAARSVNQKINTTIELLGLK